MPQAERDLDEKVLSLAEEGSLEIAIRFFDAAHETFKALVEMPGMGKIRHVRTPRLKGVRQWHVTGFEKYLVFYRPSESGIEVLRILHGARDIDRLLEESGHE